ncbi:MAG: hypothetical protein LJE95_09365 [Acidobacteria bacterium]|jgi:hypothetical protein|nr:hypothetical protein [Acidobacteriota bacterium]
MVTFLTLFIGVVSGMQSVQVAVAGPVARVELFLGSQPVATMTAPPWRAGVQLGTTLEPRALTAVAYDRNGHELGRDRQLLNLPQNRAAARIVPVTDGSMHVIAAHLVWWAPGLGEPLRTTFTVDGDQVEAENSLVSGLSRFGQNDTHVLDAHLEFSGNVVCDRTLLFGGGKLADTSAEMTAVPVAFEGRKPPHPTSWAGWFRAGGRPVDVDAVDKEAARVVLVRDLGVPELLFTWMRGIGASGFNRQVWESTVETRVYGRRQGTGYLGARPKDLLGPDVLMQLGPATVATSAPANPRQVNLFGFTGPVDARRYPVSLLLMRPLQTPVNGLQRRVADAVEMAANLAAHDNRRRAVVLCLGDGGTDYSLSDAATVRRYLRALRVPLIVWQFVAKGGKEQADADRKWGTTEVVDSYKSLRNQVERLEKFLHHQRIVWVRGAFLPQEVTLGPNAHDLRLAAEPEPGAAGP